ncbi:MAG: hypothetical protein ACRCVV_18045 [Shewanella sp.]|uniref:hypothetical protein n=1 Tax=Shewanella baltica TaxID=62322 RepID=UPI003CFE0FBF
MIDGKYISFEELSSLELVPTTEIDLLEEDINYIKNLINCFYEAMKYTQHVQMDTERLVNDIRKYSEELRNIGFKFVDLKLDEAQKICGMLPMYVVTPLGYYVKPRKKLFNKI